MVVGEIFVPRQLGRSENQNSLLVLYQGLSIQNLSIFLEKILHPGQTDFLRIGTFSGQLICIATASVGSI